MRIPLLLASLVAATTIAVSPAHACKGQTEIFNVDLGEEDALIANDAEFGDGKMTIKVAKGKIGFAMMSDEVTDSDIDLCVTFKSLRETGDNAAGAIIFWDDGSLKYVAMAFSKKSTGWTATTGAKGWKSISAEKKVEYKKGDENTLRVTLKGTEGLAFLNDKQFAKFKRKDALDSFSVGVAFQDGEWEVSKFAGTSVDE